MTDSVVLGKDPDLNQTSSAFAYGIKEIPRNGGIKKVREISRNMTKTNFRLGMRDEFIQNKFMSLRKLNQTTLVKSQEEKEQDAKDP